MSKEEIKKISEEKGLYLFHFTRLENLPSIYVNGLVPRADLQEDSYYNDQSRLDGFRNANCLSIGFPNYRMFYKYRDKLYKSESKGCDHWVILFIKRDVLWEKECAFFTTNAASKSMSMDSLDSKQGAQALQNMFREIEGIPSRQELALPEDCSTDPQAEVLVFDVIQPEYIEGVIVYLDQQKEKLKAEFPRFEFIKSQDFYSARKDYKHWKS